MSTVKEILETMDYGPAPEAADLANEWLDQHGRKFDLFIGGKFIHELIEVEGDFLAQLQVDLVPAEDRSSPVTRDAKKPEEAQRQVRPV